MEIKIEVGEERFKEVLEKELEAFTPEELHDICKEALVRQLADPNVFASLFVEDRRDPYSYSQKYYANDILKEAAKQISFQETFDELQDSIVGYIKEHHMEILHDLAISMFMNGLTHATAYNEAFRDRISEMFKSMRTINM